MNKSAVFTAIPWAIVDSVSSAALGIITVALLSRFLAPSEFGIIAFAQSIVALITITTGAGLHDALIQRKSVPPVDQDSAFWAALGLGGFGFAFCALLSGVLRAQGYDAVLCGVLLAEGSGCLFAGINTVPTAMLTRDFRASELAKRTLLSRLGYLACAPYLAHCGAGVWSVVAANLFQNAVATVTLWRGYRYTPRRTASWAAVVEMVRFGVPVMMETILWSVLTRVFNLLVGAYHGLEALGFLSLATKATDAAVGVLSTLSNRLGFPLLARLQDDRQALRRAFLKGTEALALASFPLLCGMFVTAGQWIPLIFGEQWLPAIPIVRVLCVSWILVFSRAFASAGVRALGRPVTLLIPAAVGALTTIAGVLLTVDLDFSWTMYAWLARSIVTVPVGMFLLSGYSGISYRDQVSPLIRPALASGAMMVAVILDAPQTLIPLSAQGPLFTLCATVVIGATAYGLAGIALYRSAALRVVGAVLRWPRSSPA